MPCTINTKKQHAHRRPVRSEMKSRNLLRCCTEVEFIYGKHCKEDSSQPDILILNLLRWHLYQQSQFRTEDFFSKSRWKHQVPPGEVRSLMARNVLAACNEEATPPKQVPSWCGLGCASQEWGTSASSRQLWWLQQEGLLRDAGTACLKEGLEGYGWLSPPCKSPQRERGLA